jgi:hypothetical protein
MERGKGREDVSTVQTLCTTDAANTIQMQPSIGFRHLLILAICFYVLSVWMPFGARKIKLTVTGVR